MKNGDPRVADLYAEDAVIIHGGGRAEGREAIRAFYEQTIESIHPQPEVEVVLEAAPLYVAIVNVPSTVRHFRAVDVFELGDEGIRKLEIFSRS